MNNQSNAVTRQEFKALSSDIRTIQGTMVTKDRFEQLVLQVIKNTEDVSSIKTILSEVRDIVKRQSERMDDYARDAKMVFQNDRIHDGLIRDHEKRISVLESKH